MFHLLEHKRTDIKFLQSQNPMNFKSQGGEQELLFRHWPKQPRSVHAHQVWSFQVLSNFVLETRADVRRVPATSCTKCVLKFFNNWNFQWGEDQLPHGYHHPWEELDQVSRLRFLVDPQSISLEKNEHDSKSSQPNYLLGSETFSTTMWSGWKRPSRPKRAPRTSETSNLFFRFSTGLVRQNWKYNFQDISQ